MASNFMFEVPNDEQGRYFIELCRKFASNGVSFRTYGRHSDRQKLKKQGKTTGPWGHNDVPTRHAERIVVYASTKDAYTFGPLDVAQNAENRRRRWELETKLSRAQKTIASALEKAKEELED